MGLLLPSKKDMTHIHEALYGATINGESMVKVSTDSLAALLRGYKLLKKTLEKDDSKLESGEQ